MNGQGGPAQPFQASKPITFLNELQIKIPREAKIKPMNDVVDPSIIGYDAPRTKELDLYSYQVDKKVQEDLNKTLKAELADLSTLDRPPVYVEISAANVIDRDGTIIRSSMTQKPLAWDLSINVGDNPATQTVDQAGNADSAYNNIYQSFNAGFVEFGLAYKVTKQDEKVEVRIEEEEQGKTGQKNNKNDIRDTKKTGLSEVVRTAYKKEPFNNIGHITFQVNIEGSEGVRTQVKTPKEIEKESSHKKVENRPLRAPAENVLQTANVELQLGGVVDGNHTEKVHEAIGFMNKKLHYRLKKNVVHKVDLSPFSAIINNVVNGVAGAVGQLAETILNSVPRGFDRAIGSSSIFDVANAVRNKIESNFAEDRTGENAPERVEGFGPKIDSIEGIALSFIAVSNADDSHAAARKQQKEQNRIQERNALCNKLAAFDFLNLVTDNTSSDAQILDAAYNDHCSSKIPSSTQNPTPIPAPPEPPALPNYEKVSGVPVAPGTIPGTGQAPQKTPQPRTKAEIAKEYCKHYPSGFAYYPGDPNAITGVDPKTGLRLFPTVEAYFEDLCGQKGIPFPIGLFGKPGQEVKPGTSIIQPAAVGGAGAPANTNGQDPRFPCGAIIGPDGSIMAGQSNMVPGQAAHPFTGAIVTGYSFGSGNATINELGQIVPPPAENQPLVAQVNSLGTLSYGYQPKTPIGSAVDSTGVVSSMPASGGADDPNMNAPIYPNCTLPPLPPREFFPEIDSPSIIVPIETIEDTSHERGIPGTVRRIPPIAKSLDAEPVTTNRTFLSAGPITPPSSATGQGQSSLPPPNANSPPPSPTAGTANGGSKESDEVTVEEIDEMGNWAVRSNAQGVNQTIINNVAQLQLGNVVDKTQQNSLLPSISLIGPYAQARLSLTNGTGLELDAGGNFIGFGMQDFLLRSLANGEVRSYGDLNIISDRRSVTIQAEGGGRLGADERGTRKSVGFRGTPTAELVVGRVEFRGGPKDGQPIQSAYGHDVNIAMIRHDGPDNRAIMGIDAGGNFVWESNVGNRCHSFRFPNASFALDGVTHLENGVLTETRAPLEDAKLHAQIKSKSTTGKVAQIGLDEKGTVHTVADHKHLAQSTNETEITSVAKAIYLNAPGIVQATAIPFSAIRALPPFSNDFAVGEILAVKEPVPQTEKGLLHEDLHARLRHTRNSDPANPTAPPFNRTMEYDKAGNYVLNTTKTGATTMLRSPEGEIQLGRVVAITPTTTTEERSDAPYNNPLKFRIKLAGGAKIEIDDHGNAFIDVPGDIILKSGGNFNINAPNGEINLTAKNDITFTSQKDISSFGKNIISGALNNISIDAVNDIDMTSQTQLNLESNEVTFKATNDLTSFAKNIISGALNNISIDSVNGVAVTGQDSVTVGTKNLTLSASQSVGIDATAGITLTSQTGEVDINGGVNASLAVRTSGKIAMTVPNTSDVTVNGTPVV